MVTTNTIKEIHLNEIRKILSKLQTATKPQLAAETGLSVVTINSLIKILLEQHEILEEKDTVINGGRPAAVYSLNKNNKLALLFHTHEKESRDLITASVINLCCEQTEPRQEFTELSIQNLDLSIHYYLNKYPAIELIAFALPTKEHDGKLIFCDYEALNGFPLRQYLTDKYHVPVLIENDIRIAVLGHFFRNRLSHTQCIAGIYFPQKYSAGVGLYLNGDILNGNTGIAAEVEYLPEFYNIDWNKRTFEQTLHMIQTVCVMYNPDQMIIYDSAMTSGDFKKVQEAFTGDGYQYFKPKFILSADIQEDYQYGLEQYALFHLQPALSSYQITK